jgi:hypothetical protein
VSHLIVTRPLKTIIQFVYESIVRGNLTSLAIAVIAGMATRFLSLLGLFVTFQAIVAAFRPDIIVSRANAAFQQLGTQIELTAGDVEAIIVFSIIAVFGTNLIAGRVYALAIGSVNRRVTSFEAVDGVEITAAEDTTFIDNMPDVIRSVVSVVEVSAFLLCISIFLLIFSVKIGMLVLAMVVFLAIVLVVSDRGNLRRIHEQNEARKSYQNSAQTVDEPTRRRVPTQGQERDLFASIRWRRMERTVVKPYIDAFIGAVITAIIIYVLFQTELSAESLAGLLVLFVVGIRYAVSTGRDLATHVSRLLELRKNMALIENLLEARIRKAPRARKGANEASSTPPRA